MSDRHATTHDLPGWNTPDTVLGLNQRPNAWGWAWLMARGDGKELAVLGRDLHGALYVAASASLTAQIPYRATVEHGDVVLLAGVEDGIGLWCHRSAYHRIGLIDPAEQGAQPDVPAWLPIREVLPGIPDGVPPLQV